jgi:hypothetical protein
VKLGALLAIVLALGLVGCGGSSSSSDGGTATQAGEESGAERGNLLLDAEAATFTLCLELGIDPCANEADSVAATKTFIAKTKEIAADNGLSDAAVESTLSAAAEQVGESCAECKRLLEAEVSAG